MSGLRQGTDGDFVDLKRGARVWVGGSNRSARRFVENWLREKGTVRPPEGPIDAALVTPENLEEAVHFLTKLSPRLEPEARACLILSTDQLGIQLHAQSTPVGDCTGWLESNGWSMVQTTNVGGAFQCISAVRKPDG